MPALRQSMIPEKACPALDAGWGPVFPRDKREAFARRSCSNKKIERLRPSLHEARQIVRGHGWCWAFQALDLDQAGLGDATLAQLAGADIEGERIGIAVLLQRPVGARVGRVE